MTYQLTDPQYAVDTDGTVRGWDVLTCDGSDEGVRVTFAATVVCDEYGHASDLWTNHAEPLATFLTSSEAIREGCVRAWKRWNDSFGGE